MRVVLGHVTISPQMFKDAQNAERRLRDIESGKVYWQLPDDYDYDYDYDYDDDYDDLDPAA